MRPDISTRNLSALRAARATFFSALALGLVLAGPSARAAGPLALGAEAPMKSTALKSTDGKERTIAGVAGPKGTLVIFTCEHCPYAKGWAGRIVALGNEYAKKGVGVIAINPNDPSDHAEDDFEHMVASVQKSKAEFPYVVDATSDVARAFGATKTPEAFLFDAKGKLVYHGAIDDNYEKADAVKKTYLKDALDALVNGRAIAVTETKSIGCGIKFRKNHS